MPDTNGNATAQNLGEAYHLKAGERATCHECGDDFGCGYGVLCDAACPPFDGSANYTCFGCLDGAVKVYPDPSTQKDPIIKHFEYSHLPKFLWDVCGQIWVAAKSMNDTLPNGPEKSAGLRKLLEAKDCFVRAALEKRK